MCMAAHICLRLSTLDLQDGHMALFALFDSVDDTVLVNKSILNPMIKDVDEIGIDKVGAKVSSLWT